MMTVTEKTLKTFNVNRKIDAFLDDLPTYCIIWRRLQSHGVFYFTTEQI